MTPTLLLLSGPVGGGKSTTAAALGAHLRQLGLSAASVDLDLLYGMARQSEGFGDQAVWATARRGAAALAQVFFRDGVRVVTIEGGFHTPGETQDVVDGLPADARVVFVTLQVSFDSALRRIQADPDPGRVASRIPATLRALHDEFASALPYLAGASTVIDADAVPVDEVIRRIASLLIQPGSPD